MKWKEKLRRAYQLDYGSLNTKVGISDIDGCIERYENFLCWEYKTNFNMPKGQSILLTNLSKRPNFTVLSVRGIEFKTKNEGAYWFAPTHYKYYRNGILDSKWTSLRIDDEGAWEAFIEAWYNKQTRR